MSTRGETFAREVTVKGVTLLYRFTNIFGVFPITLPSADTQVVAVAAAAAAAVAVVVVVVAVAAAAAAADDDTQAVVADADEN